MIDISARDNPKIKDCVKLRDSKKHRDETGLFIFEGIKLLEDALSSGVVIKELFITENAYIKYGEKVTKSGATVYKVTDSVYEKITCENAPQGIFCVCEKLNVHKSERKSYILILDRISDPGNFGTIVRCADAFGASEIICGNDGADMYNPKTVRACMGSLFRKKITVSENLPLDIKKLRSEGYKVYSSMLRDDALDVTKTDMTGKIALVVGNEGKGVSDEVADLCDGYIIIPMEPGPQSLNAAQAASILCWEAYKKQKR